MVVEDMVILGVCCAAASVTQSVSGFGFGVVLVAVLPIFGIPIPRVVMLVTLLVGLNIAIALWRVRRHLSLRRVVWLVAGVPFGIPVGTYLLMHGPESVLRGMLGAVLVFAAAEPFVRGGGAPAPEKRRWGFLAGVCSGALGGALSTGGPPVVIYFYRRQWSKELTKASVMLTFVATVSLRLCYYTWQGLIGRANLVDAAVLAPVVVAGSLVGERLFHSISQGGFRRALATMIVVCGAYQLYRAVCLAL